MRKLSIEKFANLTARKFSKYLGTPEHVSKIVSQKKGKEITLDYEECIDVFSYSLEVIFGEGIKIIIMCLIAYFLGVLNVTIGVIAGFCLLRGYAGGFHMKTFSKCLFTTIVIIAIGVLYSLLMVKNIYIIPFTIIAGYILVKVYAPVGSEEKPIETIERKIELNKKSISRLIMLTALAIVLILIGLGTGFIWIIGIGCGIISGILVEGFTIAPIGINILNKLEKIF